MSYEDFLETKQFKEVKAGFQQDDLNTMLKDFQSPLVRWALKRGRAALFADTGLGKTLMQLEWAHCVHLHTNKPILIIAPLAVAEQTIEEGEKFGISGVRYVRHHSEIKGNGLYITNYEMQHQFDPDYFAGIVLDESSILKNQTGKIRNEMIERWGIVPYRLSCTATPSPNDFMELGNQAEFLGIMSMSEMLSMFFVNDTGDTGTWRLKKHGQRKFFEWLATWAAVIRKPSDIGFSDEGYILPPLNIIEHTVETSVVPDGELFAKPAQTLSERRDAKRRSMNERVSIASGLVNNSDESWVVWCHLNDEQDMLEDAITDNAVSIRGNDTIEVKKDGLLGFSHDKYKTIVTKPSIAGMGLNWQNSHNMVFVGIDDSFEKFYQAVRRQYRFGQKFPVNVHIIASDDEIAVKDNIQRKQKQHEILSEEMVKYMKGAMEKEIFGASIDKTEYIPQETMQLPSWI